METPAHIVKAIVSAMRTDQLELADALLRLLCQYYPEEYARVGQTVKTAHYSRSRHD